MSRPLGLYGDWSLSYVDAGNETGTVRGTAKVVVGDDDDSNIDTQVALWSTFITRIDALTLGDLSQASYVNSNQSAVSQPTNGAARELKLLVQYECTATGKRYTLSIPTLDPTKVTYVLNINAKDVIRMDMPTEITQFITAFNAFVVAPDIPAIADVYATDPACTVIGLKVVGRRS